MTKLTEALNVCPTPERMRRGDIVEVDTIRAGITAHFAHEQDALDRLYRRCLLAPKNPGENARCYMAGQRLRTAWHESGLLPAVTGGYEPSVDGYRDPDIHMAKGIDASREYRRLIRMVGVECSGAVVDCCCLGLAVGKGASLERLRRGLARLADKLGV